MTVEQKAAAVAQLMPFVELCPTEVERDEFLKRIAQRLDLDLVALRFDFAVRLGRAKPLPPLCPLEPDAFSRWAWEQGPRHPGTAPVLVADLAFDLGLPAEMLAKDFARLAARVQANQDAGAAPFRGIV